jgi:rhodanese-related sulfurtransferase
VNDTVRAAIKESVVIIVVGTIAAIAFNVARDNGIPLIAQAEAFRVRTQAEFIKNRDAGALFEQGAAIFIDAREPQVFQIEHIEGAMNIPSSASQVDSIAWLVGADPVIIAYASESSQRQAGVIADRLLQIGFKKVYVLYGGLEAWKDLALPLGAGMR